MALTLPPTQPSRSDLPAIFIARANAFLAWIVTFVGEMNVAIATIVSSLAQVLAAAAQVATTAAAFVGSGGTLVATSANSMSVTTGSKPLSFAESGKSFAVGMYVNVARTSAAGTTRMLGAITAVDNTAKTMTVNVESVVGSGGPFTDWTISITAANNLPAATVAQVRAGTSAGVSATPAAIAGGQAFTALTFATPQPWDVAASGFNVYVVLTGTLTLSAPTNLQDGVPYCIDTVQDATGGRTWSVDPIFQWVGGTPALSTGANVTDSHYGHYRARTGKIHMQTRKGS